jgi:hypothetical protein
MIWAEHAVITGNTYRILAGNLARKTEGGLENNEP